MRKGMVFSVLVLACCLFCQPVWAETGVTDTSIKFGHFGGLSGPAGYVGKMTVDMIQAWMQHMNAQGGIHGRKLELVIEDNKWDPNLTKTAFFKLKDQGIFAIINVYGSSPCVALLDDVQKEKIPVVPTMASTSELFLPMKRYWFHLASCGQESGVIVYDYIYGDLKLKDARVAICYQDDEWGKDGKAGMEIGAKKFGKEVVAAVSFKRGSKDMTSQVTTLMMSKATHVYYVGLGPDFAMLIRTAQNLNYKPQFIGDYVSVDHRLGEWGGAATDGAWAIGVTGLPSENGWGIEEAKEVLGKYMPPPNNQFQFPTQQIIYAGAKLAEAGLKKCGRDLTRENFVEALEKTGGMDMGGLVGKIGFSKTSRKGISEYRIYKFKYDSATWSMLCDWRKPSVEVK